MFIERIEFPETNVVVKTLFKTFVVIAVIEDVIVFVSPYCI